MKTEELLKVFNAVDTKRLKVVEFRAPDSYLGLRTTRETWFSEYRDVFHFVGLNYFQEVVRLLPHFVKWVCVEEIANDYTPPNPLEDKYGIIVRIYLK